MREILFRGKRVDNGEWIYWNRFGRLTDINGEPIRVEINTSALRPYAFYVNELPLIDEETVGEYTGLTDKNGKKIFEGDIVKCKHIFHDFIDNKRGMKIPHLGYGLTFEEKWFSDTNNWLEAVYYRNYEVQFYRGSYRIKNKNITHEISYYYIFNRDSEVIGTIYDNPELLEVKE